MKRLRQIGSCRTLIDKGLSVIKAAGVKDSWLQEKEDLLANLLNGLNAENQNSKKKADDETNAPDKNDLDEIFGDKKKW